ncbi:single-stranded DNA-binding protein 3 [Sarcophilus harrisii]|uniref:single-stranded DNA-binding protein 3 n=1 Tax=Sarcophilus harrisii TaxID=9305 RepID=UPI001301C4F8|nr:single-stranded DNA-binding protein 3 [Sarcophilus harrisii]
MPKSAASPRSRRGSPNRARFLAVRLPSRLRGRAVAGSQAARGGRLGGPRGGWLGVLRERRLAIDHFSPTSAPAPTPCRLALYVYEYLLHVGAQKSAQTFLSEIRWEKNITLGEPPGFLHSWWCVFWDLYWPRADTLSIREAAFHNVSNRLIPATLRLGARPVNRSKPGAG